MLYLCLPYKYMLIKFQNIHYMHNNLSSPSQFLRVTHSMSVGLEKAKTENDFKKIKQYKMYNFS